MRTVPPFVLMPMLVLVASVAGCHLPTTASSQPHRDASLTLELTGSSTIAPLMSEIGKRFEKLHQSVRVNVQTGGSSRGITDARTGLAAIGMASRDLRADEQDLQSFALARDGVCLIVHAENPVRELTRAQIIDVYTGRTRNWSVLGGPDATITVVSKAQGRSTLEVFTDHFQLASHSIRPDIVIGDNEQGVKTVAANQHAIGYVSIGTAQYDRDAGVPIKLLPMDGVEASVETVARGEFPLSRTLNLVTADAPDALARELIDYACSPEVHDLIRELAFVPIQR